MKNLSIKSASFKVGDKVSWVCAPYQEETFTCFGTIIGVKQSVFGSKAKKMGASIRVSTKKYLKRMGKNFAFVAVDKLKLKRKA